MRSCYNLNGYEFIFINLTLTNESCNKMKIIWITSFFIEAKSGLLNSIDVENDSDRQVSHKKSVKLKHLNAEIDR